MAKYRRLCIIGLNTTKYINDDDGSDKNMTSIYNIIYILYIYNPPSWGITPFGAVSVTFLQSLAAAHPPCS